MNMKNTYQTKQRKCVLNYLEEHRDHVYSIGEIADAVSRESEIGKSTVYRLIHQLEEEGVIRLFREEGGKAFLCSYIGEASHCREHFHLKCSDCGLLFHTDCHLLGQIQHHFLEEHSFVIDPEKTVFYGLCAECRKAACAQQV